MLNAFSLRNVAIEEESRVFEEGRIALTKMLSIHSKLLDLFVEHPFDFIVFSTDQLPMTIPPRPWCDGGLGGPEYTRPTFLLRSLAEYRHFDVNGEVRARLKPRVQARPVFDALNQLGSTPWIINEPMLDVLCQVFEMSSDVSKSDFLETLAVPLRPDTVDIPEFNNSEKIFDSTRRSNATRSTVTSSFANLFNPSISFSAHKHAMAAQANRSSFRENL